VPDAGRAGQGGGGTLPIVKGARALALPLALLSAAAFASAQTPARVVVFEEFGNSG
jgi:hypothetical protein